MSQPTAPAAKTAAPVSAPAPQHNQQTGLQLRAQREREIRILLDKCTSQIAIALPSTGTLKPQAIVRAVLTEVRMSADLVDCDPRSIVRSAIEAASLGLIPNRLIGHLYLVPFQDNKAGKKVCTTIIGYRGLIDLARRSGNISTFDVYAVHEKDLFEYRLGDDAKITHTPWQPKAKSAEEADPGHMVAVYAIVRLRDGGVQRLVMTTREVDAVRAKALSKNSPAWTGHYEEMAKKTAVRRIAKLLPISVEALHLIEKDRVRDEGSEEERKASGIGDAGEDLDLGQAEIIDPETGEVTKPVQQGEQQQQPVPPAATEDAERAAAVKEFLTLFQANDQVGGDLFGGLPPYQGWTLALVKKAIEDLKDAVAKAAAKPAGKGGRS